MVATSAGRQDVPLLPLVAADTLSLFGRPWPWLLVIAAVLLTVLAPAESAAIAPFALFAYGAYGIFLLHSLLVWEHQPVLYGLVHASRGSYPTWHTSGPLGLVLTEAVVFMAAGVLLLARTVPPLLVFPVLMLWEEFLCQQLWFSWQSGPRLMAALAVAGALLFALAGLLEGVNWFMDGASRLPLYLANFYGAVPLDGEITGLFAGAQDVVLLGADCLLAPRLWSWSADAELAERARALAQRVDGLTRTRSDATDAAVAELRRIERDLHDGAQARMVAVGISLRAAEQLMSADPDAALALVTEARETSSRAIADLRDLVRGIYPPVLADRGLAEAVRNLALDTPLEARPAGPPSSLSRCRARCHW